MVTFSQRRLGLWLALVLLTACSSKGSISNQADTQSADGTVGVGSGTNGQGVDSSTGPIGGSANKPATLGAGTSSSATASLTYYGHTQKIFTVCSDCHYPGAQAPDYSTPGAVTANAEAGLASIKAGTMPPAGALSATDIATVSGWIAGGKSTGNPTASLATAAVNKVSYTTGAQEVIQRRCVACHFTGNKIACKSPFCSSATIADLSTYERINGVGPVAYFMTQVQKTMPPAKNLTEQESQILQAWYNSGSTR